MGNDKEKLELEVKHVDTLDRVLRNIKINEIAVEYTDTLEIKKHVPGQPAVTRWKRYGQVIRFTPKTQMETSGDYRREVDTLRREIRTRVEDQQLEDLEKEAQEY